MKNRWLVVFILLLASFMDLLDTTIVNVALPAISEDLGASSSQLEWIVSGYVLAFAVLLITGGRLGDRFGRKTVFVSGVIGFTLASFACAVASTADVLVISRILQGAFGALMIPQVLSIIQVMFKPKERAAVFGALGAVSGLAAVSGPLIGGSLVSSDAFGLGWRSIFVINIPVGILLIAASFIFITNSKSDKPIRIDVAGVLLITSALFMLVFALIQGRELEWPLWIWLMIVASPVLIAVFVWIQYQAEKTTGAALIPPSLFKNRGYSAGAITSFASTASVASFYLIFTIYLQTGLGFSALDAGLASLPFSVGAFFGSGIAVPLAARLGKTLIFTGAILQLAGYFWVARVVLENTDNLVGTDVLLPLALAGVGLTLVLVPLNDVALAEINVSDAGAASGVLSTFQQVGTAIAIAVIGVVFFGVTDGNFSPSSLRDAFDAAVWVTLAAVTITGLFSFLLPSVTQVRAHKEAAEALDV